MSPKVDEQCINHQFRLSTLENSFNQLENKLDNLDTKLDDIELMVTKQDQQLFNIKENMGRVLELLNPAEKEKAVIKITAIETKLNIIWITLGVIGTSLIGSLIAYLF